MKPFSTNTLVKVVPAEIEPVIANAPSFLKSNAFRRELGAPADWTDPFLPFDPSKLPPLPEIPLKEIADLAVRHKTIHQRRCADRSDVPPRYGIALDSYEVLEGIGDAYLTSAVSRILRQMYRDLPTGALFDLRERLVRNDTISYLSLHYKLPSRLEFDTSTSMNLKQSVAADLFEAHIGGLVEYEDRERKSTDLDEWLKGVFREDVWISLRDTKDGLKSRKMEQEEMRLEQRRHKKAKQISRWECDQCDQEEQQGSQAKFRFDTLDPTKGWHAKLFLDGEFVSCGYSKVKKEAEVAAGVNCARRLTKAR